MEEAIKKIVHTYKDVRGGLIPALHAVQAVYGNYLPEGALARIAQGLNIPPVSNLWCSHLLHPVLHDATGENIIRVCESPPAIYGGAEYHRDIGR